LHSNTGKWHKKARRMILPSSVTGGRETRHRETLRGIQTARLRGTAAREMRPPAEYGGPKEAALEGLFDLEPVVTACSVCDLLACATCSVCGADGLEAAREIQHCVNGHFLVEGALHPYTV